MEEKQQMGAWSDDQWRFPYKFFNVTERWAGNANEHLWSTQWCLVSCCMCFCSPGWQPCESLLYWDFSAAMSHKVFLLLYMRFFFMLEELCFVFFSSISTIGFAPSMLQVLMNGFIQVNDTLCRLNSYKMTTKIDLWDFWDTVQS